MPVSWEGQTAIAEYDNLCANVNLYDASIQRQVEISGPDAYQLAQLLCSRNLKKQKIGQCMYGIITDEEGTVINDPLILKLAEDRYWFSIADR
jgi:dimethylsulfoniopropionate demethylase